MGRGNAYLYNLDIEEPTMVYDDHLRKSWGRSGGDEGKLVGYGA